MRTRLRTLAAVLLIAGAAWPAEPPSSPAPGAGLRLDVLRAEAYGSLLDVLLRIEPPADLAGEIGPGDITVYVAPAALPPAEAAAEPFRIRRLFVKRLGGACYVDLRQLPQGVGGTALQLVVQIAHGGRLLSSHHLAHFLDAPADALDVALVIDESLSMTRTDPEWLRIAAAKTFVDMARRSTRIGHIAVVGFNERARTLVPLTPTSQPDPLYQAIKNINSMGQTDLDAALDEARKVLERSPNPNKVALLLTDGKDEPGVYENAHRAFAERHWRIYTVGLSQRADTEVLQRIAADTGGDYHCAPTNAELQDIFSKICVTLHKKLPIRSRDLSLQANTPAEDEMPVDDTISAMTVRLDTREPEIAFVLRDPANRLLTPELPKSDQTAAYGRKPDYQHYDLWGLTPGRCVARVTSPRPAEATVAATAVTPLLLRAFPLKPAYRRGEPIEIAASLANADAVLADARVEARVLAPGGAGPQSVALHDDGQHLDTAARDGVFAGVYGGAASAGPLVIHLVATGTTPAGHRFERGLQVTTTISAEDVRPPKLVLAPEKADLGAIESGGRAEATIELWLDPRGTAPARLISSDPRLTASPNALTLGTRPEKARLVFASPAGQATGTVAASLTVETRIGRTEVPVSVRVVRPSLTVSPAAVDFGEVSPGQAVERQVTLSLEGLEPRAATLAASPLVGPAGVPPIPLAGLPGVKLSPGEPAAAQVALRVPPAQPPGDYRGELLVKTPLGEQKVACTAKVGAANTFQAVGTVDFGELAIGATKEAVIEVQSLVAADQKVELALPPPLPDCQLTAEPASLSLGSQGKAVVTFRLTALAAAKPGPRSATATFRGPSRGATIELRAKFFRPPHLSVAFEPAEVDVGRLKAGIAEKLSIRVRSLVDEAQSVTLEAPTAPADVLAISAEPAAFTLAASASQAINLTLSPLGGPHDAPFVATVTARGRSLPATLRVRGTVYTPLGDTFALAERVLDFGPMSPGQHAELALAIQSLLPREQRVSLAIPPSAGGITLISEPSGAMLLPGVMHPIGIGLSVGPDASPGERRVTWVVRGSGLSATFEGRVEIEPPPPPVVAAAKPRGIGWQEGVLLFLLLLLLLAILVATYLLARWLVRSQRVPGMAKFFGISALLHVAAFFITLDLFVAHKVQKQELGPLFSVGIKAIGGGAFSSEQASAADEVRAQGERERRLDAERRQQQAARIARDLLASERHKLDPTDARLDKPQAEEKPDLAPRMPDERKLTVESLAELVEELREAPTLKQEAKQESKAPADVPPSRIAELRSMSREQLEAVVRGALQPKPADARKAAAASDVPGLAEAKAADKAAMSPEELIPAMEALKQGLAKAETTQATAGTPAAGDVGAQKAGQQATAERAAASGERVAVVAGARAADAAARPATERLDPVAELMGPAKPNGESKAAAPTFAVPEETIQPSETAGQRPGPQSPAAGLPEAQDVAAARPGGQATPERATAAGQRPALAGARAAGGTEARAMTPNAFTSLPRELEGPPSERRAPAVTFATPEERPGADELVRLPAPAEGSSRGTDPVVVSFVRPALGGGADLAGHQAAAATRLSAGSPQGPAEPAATRDISPGRLLSTSVAIVPQQGAKAAPDLPEQPEESIEPGRRVAEGGAQRGAQGPASVAITRPGGAIGVERVQQIPATDIAGPSARTAEAGRPEMATAAAFDGARPSRGSDRRSYSPVADAPSIVETVAAGPQAAEGRQATPVVALAVNVARATRGQRAAEPSRSPAPAPMPRLEPRDPSAGRGQGASPSRLLLPDVAMRRDESGALVGDRSGTVRNFVLATAKYGADWDTHRTAMPFLAWQLRERVGFNIETDVVDVPLDSAKIMKTPWIYLTGHKDFRFSDAEAANLRRYLVGGGALWAEDCTNEDDPTWDTAFRREIARVLSPRDGYTMRKITKEDDHPIFRSCFDLRDGYKGYFPPPGDKFRKNFLEGIEIEGRLAVVYTRNDYGCGLEIKPDTHPGKVSLSGLSPAEMQESSFLMASNIIIYALTGGRGVTDEGIAGRAAASLRRQREEGQAQRDPYENAPVALFDDFSAESWAAETTWDKAGPATLRYQRHTDPKAEGRSLAVRFQLRPDDAKAVIIRDLPQELDLTGQDRCYLDIESRLEGGARLAIALITMPGWKYVESRPAFIKPGRQRVSFDLHTATWKTGEPVAEGESEYSRRPANTEAVRRFVLMLYPVQQEGTVVIDRIEFRSKP